MRFPFVRLVPAALVATLVACGTPEAGAERLKELTVGITRDSAMTLLGEGTLTAAQADTIRVDHGHRRSRYLIQGKFYTVLYVRDEPGDVNEPVTQSLETRQSAARVGLRFRYGFEEHELSPEVTADVGMGWRVFELGQNDEYRGTNYRYWVLGVGGAVPLTTPLAILEAKFNYAPTADLAESTRELAAKADVIGFGFTAGMTSRFAPGWSASLLYDWQMFTLDLDGGSLEIDWRGDGVWMTGPTAHVFDGQLSAEFVSACK